MELVDGITAAESMTIAKRRGAADHAKRGQSHDQPSSGETCQASGKNHGHTPAGFRLGMAVGGGVTVGGKIGSSKGRLKSLRLRS